MKRFNFIYIPTAILALVIIACNRPLKNAEVSLTICSTTDLHGAYFDSTYVAGEANTTSLSKVSSYLRSLREEGVDPILVDVGDNLQGDLAAFYFNYVDTVSKHLFVRISEYLGYDAIVIGNHDIEATHAVFDRVRESSSIPYLAANAAKDKNENGIADIEENPGKLPSDSYFLPYTVVKRDDVRIAVIGMTNGNIKSWLSSDAWHGIDFQRISDIAQAQVDFVVNKEKPHVVILAVHSGSGDGSAPDQENEAMYLASVLSGVDVVLGGHDHSVYAELVANPTGEVALVNGANRAKNIGCCRIDLKIKRGRVVSKKLDVSVVPMADVEADAEYDARFREDFLKVKRFANRVICKVGEEIDFTDALKGPSSYINLIQTVQLEATGADVSFCAPLSNSGKVEKGNVTYLDLANIYRFENALFVVEMTGRQIKDYLEFSFDNWVNNVGPAYNFDSAAGISYTVSRSSEKGNRVNITAMTDGTPFDLERSYSVAMTSYRANGGGGLLSEGAGMDPSKLEVVRKLPEIRTLVGNYLERCGVYQPAVSENWKFVE